VRHWLALEVQVGSPGPLPGARPPAWLGLGGAKHWQAQAQGGVAFVVVHSGLRRPAGHKGHDDHRHHVLGAVPVVEDCWDARVVQQLHLVDLAGKGLHLPRVELGALELLNDHLSARVHVLGAVYEREGSLGGSLAEQQQQAVLGCQTRLDDDGRSDVNEGV